MEYQRLSIVMINRMPNTTEIRNAIIESLPADTSYSGRTPPLEHLYVPATHLKALRPECQLVVGSRGVGKSVWTAALHDKKLRSLIGSSIAQLDDAEIHIGFSERPSNIEYPDGETFESLIKMGYEPYIIWRAILIRWLSSFVGKDIPMAKWPDTVDWVTKNAEEFASITELANNKLSRKDQFGIILFDALDRLSSSWQVMDDIVRGLFRVALWLKPYSNILAKIFVREDQMERTVTDFPDASKLLSTKADLSWARHDLHGLLWQYLLNGPGTSGVLLRDLYHEITGHASRSDNERFLPHDECKRDTDIQRSLFEALAGPWMGKDRRRGVPYMWTVGHLSDGQGRTSPRSFIAAIRQAAEDSSERYTEHSYTLHYESIKRGVQKASEIRVEELSEDYPWVKPILSSLSGLTVPIQFETMLEKLEETFPEGFTKLEIISHLPPQHIDNGWRGLREDLITIGVFEERKDGRIDMPDLYRVGFGLGRRGGVKPKK